MPKSSAHTGPTQKRRASRFDRLEKATRKTGRSAVVLRGTDSRKNGRRNKQFPNLNIRETAGRMGINESHLSRLLTKKTVPSLSMAAKLAGAFGLTIEQVAEIYRHGSVNEYHIPGAE